MIMIAESYKKLSTNKKIVIYVTIFIALCGFSNIALAWSGWGSRPSFYIGLFLFAFSIMYRNKIGKGEMTGIVNWTLISACLSFIPAIIDWNARFESFFYGFIATYYGFFFYYLLRIWKVAPQDIMKIVAIFCLIWVVLEIGQQFTYPEYWFLGRRNENNFVENRMGLWRFYIWGIDFVMLAFSYYAGKFFDGNNKKKVILCASIFAIGILCYCSRKHIISILAVCVWGLLYTKSKHKWKLRIVCAVLMFLLIFNFYADYAQMSEDQSDAQGSGEDFIRYLAALFYLNDFSNSPLYPIFGTGWGSTALNNRLDYCMNVLRFFRADIGLLGYYSTVGIVGASAILLYIYKFIRNWKYIDFGYKIFFAMKMFLIIFDFWMSWAIGIIAYGTFLYLLDENIKHNKRIENEHRNTHILQGC